MLVIQEMKCALNGITIANCSLQEDLQIASATSFEGIEIWRQLFRPKLEEFLSKNSAEHLAVLIKRCHL
jgi:hypothetical protein